MVHVCRGYCAEHDSTLMHVCSLCGDGMYLDGRDNWYCANGCR